MAGRPVVSFARMVRWLLVFSVVALILGPVIMIMGAFSPSSCLIALALLIMGALGLFAGMKAQARGREGPHE